MKVRINKFLADCGVSSRRKSEELILQGRVTVNNKVVSELSFQIDPDKDLTTLDGEVIKPKKHLYFILNKPKGTITSTKDDKQRRTVMELIKVRERVYPVGRLDYNTTGALLLTNDGDFSQLLTHPKNKVPREYEVKLDKSLSKDDERKLLNGVKIERRAGRFLRINYIKEIKLYHLTELALQALKLIYLLVNQENFPQKKLNC
jgi:23S rRNA pseudouridine2605 synthase